MLLVLTIASLVVVGLGGVITLARDQKYEWRWLPKLPTKTVLCLLIAAFLIQVLELYFRHLDDEADSMLLAQSHRLLTESQGRQKNLEAKMSELGASNARLTMLVQYSEKVLSKQIIERSDLSSAEDSRLRAELTRLREDLVKEQRQFATTMGRSAIARILDGYDVELMCSGVEPCTVADAVNSILAKYNSALSIKRFWLGADSPDYVVRWLERTPLFGDTIVYRYDHDEAQVQAIASLVIAEHPQLRFNYLPSQTEPPPRTLYIILRSSKDVLWSPVPR